MDQEQSLFPPPKFDDAHPVPAASQSAPSAPITKGQINKRPSRVRARRRRLALVFFALAIIITVGLVYAIMSQNQNSGQNAPTNIAGGSLSNTIILINSSGFNPAQVTVKKGSIVIWKNNDTNPHTVTTDSDGPHSPTLNPGDSYEDTFTATGDYSYYDALHANMKGVIHVTQ